MKKLWLAVALFLVSAPVWAQSNVRPMYDNTSNGGISTQTVDPSHGLPVQMGGGGTPTTPAGVYIKQYGTATYVKTSVSLTGSSQQLLAANTSRVGFVIYNQSTNANVFVDLAGGTVASETGILIGPGGRFSVTGSATPKTIVTIIGTNTQTVIVWEGS